MGKQGHLPTLPFDINAVTPFSWVTDSVIIYRRTIVACKQIAPGSVAVGVRAILAA